MARAYFVVVFADGVVDFLAVDLVVDSVDHDDDVFLFFSSDVVY
jgi:hypothetical protein